jgi:hypothetical protein
VEEGTMVSSRSKRGIVKEKGLRHSLLIIEFLIVVIPFLILLHIFYREQVLLNSSQMALIALALLLVLTGLMLLRRILDRISLLATSLKKAEEGEKGAVKISTSQFNLNPRYSNSH